MKGNDIRYIVEWTIRDTIEWFSNRDNIRMAILWGYAPANLLMVVLKGLGI